MIDEQARTDRIETDTAHSWSWPSYRPDRFATRPERPRGLDRRARTRGSPVHRAAMTTLKKPHYSPSNVAGDCFTFEGDVPNVPEAQVEQVDFDEMGFEDQTSST